MFDVETVPRLAPKMPVDFAAYLLSSSPPASNLNLLSLAFSSSAVREWDQANMQDKDCRRTESCRITEECLRNDDSDANRNSSDDIISLRKAIKPIMIRKDDAASDGDMSDTSCDSGRVTPTSPCSPRVNKKVSFADHKGFALATVRIMTEASDQPPKLREDVMKSITKDEEAVVSGLPPLRLKFTQPASDYMAFRDKIEKNTVSLENVILRDYSVLGTIKVKNVCFDKHVFLRCTFDSWKSSQDFQAKFVKPFGGNLVHNFDTFSFEFDIDSQNDKNNKIQFAVCFKSPCDQYWDNNGGANYEIIPTDFSSSASYMYVTDPLPTSTRPSLRKVQSWSEYSCWRHVDTSSPYY